MPRTWQCAQRAARLRCTSVATKRAGYSVQTTIRPRETNARHRPGARPQQLHSNWLKNALSRVTREWTHEGAVAFLPSSESGTKAGR